MSEFWNLKNFVSMFKRYILFHQAEAITFALNETKC